MSLRKEKQNKINIEKGLPVISNHICSAHADTNFMDTLVDLQKIDGYPLEYEIELLQVLKKGEYLLEPWEMTVSQRYEEALRLKESGNSCYKIADTKGALRHYTRALAMIESLATAPEIVDAKRELKLMDNERERKEWLAKQEKRRMIKKEIIEFNSENAVAITDDIGMNFTIEEMEALDITLRLNFCACQLKLGGFNQVIIQCSEILKRDPDNLKAFFRRCQAYCSIGRDLDLAENDCKALRSCLTKIDKEQKRSEWTDLRKMEQNINQKLAHHQEKEKQLFAGIFKS
jgi:tetratricopeptide (TPR) repeat protein